MSPSYTARVGPVAHEVEAEEGESGLLDGGTRPDAPRRVLASREQVAPRRHLVRGPTTMGARFLRRLSSTTLFLCSGWPRMQNGSFVWVFCWSLFLGMQSTVNHLFCVWVALLETA